MRWLNALWTRWTAPLASRPWRIPKYSPAVTYAYATRWRYA